MNTSKLKSFAPEVRRQLMQAVKRRLDYVLTADTADLRSMAAQVASLRRQANRERDALVERVAYTWFNRLAALRFLDARGWHPFKARILTPATADETQPEVLKLLRTGSLPEELRPHTDLARLNDLLDGRLPTAIAGADPQGEAYRHLILAACRFYHATMPFLFEAIDDETELLLPDDLLTATSVAEGFRTDISDDDCAEVEILGWLYQFYISEKKDAVMARRKAVPSEDIPAVTQLFTPHWIVRYLVENSLGRLWLNSRPNSRLREHMPYYVPDPAEDPKTEKPETDEPKTEKLTVGSPEEIRLLDPACGSGHMLTYAFDLLVKIYEEEGHAPGEIPEKILIHNLFGLEICPRAAQLASFALVCKSREQSRRAFRSPVQPQVMCLRDVLIEEDELKAFFSGTDHWPLTTDELKQIHQFREHTETFGALIQPVLDGEKLAALKAKIGKQAPAGDLLMQNTHRKLRRVLDQAEMLSQRYQVVVANPPYMGPKQMPESLKGFAAENFPRGKTDLYAMFVEQAFALAHEKAYCAMITMQSWMFLHSFEAFRTNFLQTRSLLSMAHLGTRAFDTISGEIVTVTAFCWRNQKSEQNRAIFLRLIAGNESIKERALREGSNRYINVEQAGFSKIPGSPVAYWIGDHLQNAFAAGKVEDLTISDGQNITANNDQFVRTHWEVGSSQVGRELKWRLYAKGGSFRRWYGNLEAVVDWSPEARKYYRQASSARIIPEYLWYRLGITWSRVGTALAGFRVLPPTATFDKVGSSVFLENESDCSMVLALLNCRVTQQVLDLLNPSIDIQVKDVRNVPLVQIATRGSVEAGAEQAVSLARADWDNFETSWDFRDLPLLRSDLCSVASDQTESQLATGHLPLATNLKGRTLAESWANYAAYCTAAIRRMQELETENNRLWIDAYGLQDELTPEVPEDEITLARADRRKDVAAFLSYAVGCMMGRYSLDAPGLICANAGDTVEDYLRIVAEKQANTGVRGQGTGGSAESGLPPAPPSSPTPQFRPDTDGIVPLLDGEWFTDDVVARTREFLRVSFGDDSLEENLRFIEESLGKDLRKYFLSDFYKDHLQTYKKRPIYWLFQSPKKGFGALVYLHRYTRDTVNTLLNDYLRDFLKKLESRIEHLEHVQDSAGSAREKTAATKEADKLRKTLKECREWERDVLLPLAQQRLEIDLDHGVKANYPKFGKALATIAGFS